MSSRFDANPALRGWPWKCSATDRAVGAWWVITTVVSARFDAAASSASMNAHSCSWRRADSKVVKRLRPCWMAPVKSDMPSPTAACAAVGLGAVVSPFPLEPFAAHRLGEAVRPAWADFDVGGAHVGPLHRRQRQMVPRRGLREEPGVTVGPVGEHVLGAAQHRDDSGCTWGHGCAPIACSASALRPWISHERCEIAPTGIESALRRSVPVVSTATISITSAYEPIPVVSVSSTRTSSRSRSAGMSRARRRRAPLRRSRYRPVSPKLTRAAAAPDNASRI